MIQKVAFLIIAIINFILSIVLYFSAGQFKKVFDELLAGEAIPEFTQIMFYVTPAWPVFFGVISLILMIFSSKINEKYAVSTIIVMIICEVVLFLISVAGLMLPLLQVSDKLS